MDERRKHPRKDLMSYSQVHDLREGRLIGYLGDLNPLGAMVIGEQAIEPNTEMTISIELPDLPDVQETNVVIPVRIVWCHEDISPDYFNIGVEFQTVTERQKVIIDLVMENYEFRRQSPNYPPHPTEFGMDR